MTRKICLTHTKEEFSVNPVLLGTIYLILYFAIAASTALLCHYMFPIPKELFRKILHFILLGSFLVFIFAYPTWYSAALAAIIFELLVYPILAFFERYKGYSELTTERKKGELKNSLLLVFTMFSIVDAICWGILGDKFLALASLYTWVSEMLLLLSSVNNSANTKSMHQNWTVKKLRRNLFHVSGFLYYRNCYFAVPGWSYPAFL